MATERKKKAELVFVPTPGAGHFVPAVELAKRLIHADDRLSVTILCMPSPFNDPRTSRSLLPSEATRLRFIDLPHQDPPPFCKCLDTFILLVFNSFTPHVKDTIVGLMSGDSRPPLAGLVLDFFCLPMVAMANELGLPPYLFLTNGGGSLSLMIHLTTRQARIGTELRVSDPDLELPGFVNPIPVRLLPEGVTNEHGGYAAYMELAQRFGEVKGIIVNTFSELQPYVGGSFGICGESSSSSPPPVYAVGPVIDVGGRAHANRVERDGMRIMRWLDAQPESSVVFLCFGSIWSVGEAQVREMAVGLERSGYRFLWVFSLREPGGEPGGGSGALDPAKLKELLPEGFEDRTGGRGMICNWAPQMEVLGHKAVGGFVSHCGWNSVLESRWNGVPMATWPLFAEQGLNAFELVKELGLAVEMRLNRTEDNYGEGGGGGSSSVATGEEIGAAITGLMDADGCSTTQMMRKKVKEMAEMSRRAVMDGGSSSKALTRLIADIINNVVL